MFFVSFQSLWIYSLINYKPPTYNNGDYQYPIWAHALGWFYTAVSLAFIPIFAIVAIVRAKGNSLGEVNELYLFKFCMHNFTYFVLFFLFFRKYVIQLNQKSMNVKFVVNIIVNTMRPILRVYKKCIQFYHKIHHLSSYNPHHKVDH